MRFTTFAMSALVALASAYTQPDYSEAPSGNPIAYPGLAQQVPKGEPFTIQWTPTTSGPISLVLLQGPSSNVVPYQTIVEKIPNSGKYVWTPAESIPDDVTHYGLLLVDDATGQYQWSTQFGICEADGSYTTSASASATSTAASTVTAAPTATAVTVVESESTTICPETETGSSASVTATPTATAVTVVEEESTTICPETESQTAAPTTIPIVIGTGTTSVPLIPTSAPASAPSTLVSTAYVSSTPTASSVSATYTGAAGRNVISFGAIAAGVMAVLAF